MAGVAPVPAGHAGDSGIVRGIPAPVPVAEPAVQVVAPPAVAALGSPIVEA